MYSWLTHIQLLVRSFENLINSTRSPRPPSDGSVDAEPPLPSGTTVQVNSGDAPLPDISGSGSISLIQQKISHAELFAAMSTVGLLPSDTTDELHEEMVAQLFEEIQTIMQGKPAVALNVTKSAAKAKRGK